MTPERDSERERDTLPAPAPVDDPELAADIAASLDKISINTNIMVRLGAAGHHALTLRAYIDRVRNALQALEGCAAALEG